MATTTYGSPYVQSSDLVSGWPTSSLAVADRIDDVAMKGNGINAQTGTTYTTILTDAGKTITTSNAAAVTVTIPTNASVAYEIGSVIQFLNIGVGALTIAASGGVTINNNLGTTAQYGAYSIIKTATDTWYAVPFISGSAKATVSATTGSPTITTVSGKTLYKFTGSGSITITAGSFDYLLIAGGGSGGKGTSGYTFGGGGGGGGVTSGTGSAAAGTFTMTVGAGGAGSATASTTANGVNSSAFGYIAGSGTGGEIRPVGRGGASGCPTQFAGGGVYNTTNPSGGGAGAGAVGTVSAGGAGAANSITGSSVTYGGGGGGGGDAVAGAGGAGGGGNGAANGGTPTSGAVNSGGGGGGMRADDAPAAGSGGSGCVFILIG